LAMTAPQGPVWVEIPQDILLEAQDFPAGVPALVVDQPEAAPALVAQAAELINAESTVIVAGGGVRRSGAGELLAELAEKVDDPVACTVGGHAEIPRSHRQA